MDTETTEADIDSSNDEGEGQGTEAETIALSKQEYEKLNQTLGSLKRELKDLKKPKESAVTPTENQKPEDSALSQKLEKMALRQAAITHPDDVELARNTAKKWGVDIDEVIDDEDFKVKLERQQTSRSNAAATSNIRGSGATGQAKFDAAYWIAKGVPPSATDVPDRKTRAGIARAMMKNAGTSGKTFYND